MLQNMHDRIETHNMQRLVNEITTSYLTNYVVKYPVTTDFICNRVSCHKIYLKNHEHICKSYYKQTFISTTTVYTGVLFSLIISS